MIDRKVSIITVCFNSEMSIEKTIKSVLSQDYNNIEYVIIDGKSTDCTMEIVEQYRSKLLDRGYDFRVLSEPDKGIYDAMNKGISIATGELVGLINSGDWYEPEAVSCAVDYYEKYGYDMFFADLRIHLKNKTMIKSARLQKIVTTRDWNHLLLLLHVIHIRAFDMPVGGYMMTGISFCVSGKVEKNRDM